MADPVAALSGASFDGIAKVEANGPQGMITLRGDLADAGFAKAIGLPMPKPLSATQKGDTALLWMSPDELLLLCPYEEVAARLDNLRAALTDQFALAVDVSDARATFAISGDGAREALAKLSPADLSPDAFTPGTVRRTRLAQIPAALWLAENGEFRILCLRSVAGYAFEILKRAASDGSDVGVFSNLA